MFPSLFSVELKYLFFVIIFFASFCNSSSFSISISSPTLSLNFIALYIPLLTDTEYHKYDCSRSGVGEKFSCQKPSLNANLGSLSLMKNSSRITGISLAVDSIIFSGSLSLILSIFFKHF